MTLPVVLPLWISISAYGRAWGLTRTTVYKLLTQNRLETYRLEAPSVIRIKNIAPCDHHPVIKPIS